MKTDALLDDYLPEWDVRRTRQVVVPADPAACAAAMRDDGAFRIVVVPADPAACAAAMRDDGAFRDPLPGVPGRCSEPWLRRRYRGAVGDVPSTVLRDDDRCFVVGAVGRRFGPAICWLAATPGAVRTVDEPGHCRVANATVFREREEGTLAGHQVRLCWTDGGPPAAVEDAMKLALGNGMQRRLDRLAAAAAERRPFCPRRKDKI